MFFCPISRQFAYKKDAQRLLFIAPEISMTMRQRIGMHIYISIANTQQIDLESAPMAEILNITVADAMPSVDPRDVQVHDMLLAVIRSLVDEVDKIEFVRISGGEGMAFQVRLAANDVGKLIGKGGRTARAIRCILSGNAAKNGRRYSLDIARVEGTN